MSRWIVDTDGMGSFAVCESRETGGKRCSECMPLDRAERMLVRLKARDVEQAQRAKVESGRRLAALRRAGL